jgi:hypothetical protein
VVLLLVLVPVCVLLTFTVLVARNEWRHASGLRHFRTATDLSLATAALADALAGERLATVVWRLRPDAQRGAELASAQRGVDDALRHAAARAAGWNGTLDVAQTLDAARRQLQPLRLQAATGTPATETADESYSLIVNNLLGTVGNLDIRRPTQASGRAADAYLAILQATEDAERERVDLTEVLARPRGIVRLPSTRGRPLKQPSSTRSARTPTRGSLTPRAVRLLGLHGRVPLRGGVRGRW